MERSRFWSPTASLTGLSWAAVTATAAPAPTTTGNASLSEPGETQKPRDHNETADSARAL